MSNGSREKVTTKDLILPFFEFKILSVGEAEELVENDKLDRWNVISIHSPIWSYGPLKGKYKDYKPIFFKAKRLSQHIFSDIEREEEGLVLCSEKHIKDILDFSKECIGENLLVHCHAGISRSTAIGFLILLDLIKDKTETPMEAVSEMIYKTRPVAMPNRHILNIGIPLIANNQETEIKWFRELYNSRLAHSFGL